MFKDSLKTIALSLAILSLISVAYAWIEPSSNPPAGNVSAPVNVSDTGQIKLGSLQVNGFRNLGNTSLDGTLSVGSNITAGGQSVITSLSAGSGISISGSGNSRTVTNTSSLTESDPTVPASVKDGIAWSEISLRPSGLDDGDQVTGDYFNAVRGTISITAEDYSGDHEGCTVQVSSTVCGNTVTWRDSSEWDRTKCKRTATEYIPLFCDHQPVIYWSGTTTGSVFFLR